MQLSEAAIHEAGHALVALRVGADPVGVGIRATANDGLTVMWRLKALAPEVQAAVILAGTIAAKMAGFTPTGCHLDHADARALGLSAPALLRAAQYSTAILQARWRGVMALAETLDRQGFVSGKDAVEVVRCCAL